MGMIQTEKHKNIEQLNQIINFEKIVRFKGAKPIDNKMFMICLKQFLLTTIIMLVISISSYSQTIRVDLQNAMGGTVSQLFDSVKYIPLETTKESLFGKIDRMEVIDSFFLISDFLSTQSILIFNKSGKFHSKIENIPNNKFAVDRKSKEVYIYNNGKFYIYNMDGILVKKVEFDKNGDMQQYTSTGNGGIIYISTKQKGDSLICLLNYCNLFSSKSTYIQILCIPIGSPKFYERTTITLFNVFSSFLNWSDNRIFFSLKYVYNIYEADTSGALKDAYSFLFPLTQSLQKNYIMDTIFTKGKARLLSERENTITEIPDFYLLKNNIVFSVVPSAIDNGYRKSFFLYSIVSGDLLSFKHISPDISSFFLPVGENVSAVDKSYYYSSLASFEMFRAHDENVKTVNYSPSLYKYFATQSRKSNPVIVQLKPKNKL